MKKIESQCDAILDYMQTHKQGITPIDALGLCGCFRLSARIWDLRHKGFVIESRPVRGQNYCRYVLLKEERGDV